MVSSSGSGIDAFMITRLPILRGAVSHCQTPLFGKRGGGSGGGDLSGWAGASEDRSDPAANTTIKSAVPQAAPVVTMPE